tara:strand:- start:20 stop:577 length:558 start_codon:yes stop_codon:yes gene_type:complete
MKKLFTLLLAATLLVACNNTKTEKTNTTTEMNKVEILVTNSTDQIVSITATYGIDTKGQVWNINPGDSATIASNCSASGRTLPTECSEFQAQLLPVGGSGNPSTGKFSLSYQLEPGNQLKCIDWNAYGSPMESTIYSLDTDWKYTLTWGSNPANQTGWPIKNTVEIKDATCTTTAVTGGTGFKCE